MNKDPFTGEAPCQWCGARPTVHAIITPAVVQNLTIVKRPIWADVCQQCARRLKLAVAGFRDTGEQVKIRHMLLSERRAERRAAMQSNQEQLFEPPRPQPQSPIGG